MIAAREEPPVSWKGSLPCRVDRASSFAHPPSGGMGFEATRYLMKPSVPARISWHKFVLIGKPPPARPPNWVLGSSTPVSASYLEREEARFPRCSHRSNSASA